MKKSKQRKASKRKHGVDRISNMPDAIILSILSRLPSTEEVIRTSILSRRWGYLWTSVPSIDIRCGDKLSGNEFKEFLYWVLVNKSVDLDRFHLFCPSEYSMSTIGRWIHAAVTKNVKELELLFCRKEVTEDIQMPNCLVTCSSLEVLELNLDLRGLRLPNCMGFPALRVLDLTCVNLLEDDNLVKKYLESCKLLEDLTLLDCLLGKLDHLCISCQNLKKLSIINLAPEDHGLCEDIKICCPKLVDLDLTGHIACNYLFECLDSLKEAVIEPKLLGSTMSVLFPGIYLVESLLIDFSFFYQCIYAASDPSLPNLKILMLSTTIDDFIFDEFIRILKYYPKVESLQLIVKEEFDGPELCELHEGDARRIFTHHLKKVEVFEFNGEKSKIVTEWDENILEMVFSWGNKGTYKL